MFKINRNVLAGVVALVSGLSFSVDANAGPYVRQARSRPAYTASHSRYYAPSYRSPRHYGRSYSSPRYYGRSYSYPRYYAPSYGVAYARPYRSVSYASPYVAVVRPAPRVIYDAPAVEYVVPSVSEPTIVYEDYSWPTYDYVVPQVRGYYYDSRPYRYYRHSFGLGFGYSRGHHGHHGGFGFRFDL